MVLLGEPIAAASNGGELSNGQSVTQLYGRPVAGRDLLVDTRQHTCSSTPLLLQPLRTQPKPRSLPSRCSPSLLLPPSTLLLPSSSSSLLASMLNAHSVLCSQRLRGR